MISTFRDDWNLCAESPVGGDGSVSVYSLTDLLFESVWRQRNKTEDTWILDVLRPVNRCLMVHLVLVP